MLRSVALLHMKPKSGPSVGSGMGRLVRPGRNVAMLPGSSGTVAVEAQHSMFARQDATGIVVMSAGVGAARSTTGGAVMTGEAAATAARARRERANMFGLGVKKLR